MVSLFLFTFVVMSKLLLRSGKYKGKTVDWVEDNDPSYLVWVEENRPEMLKESKKTPDTPNTNVKFKAITPNTNFDNEPPEWHEF